MTSLELKRWLIRQGALFNPTPGKGGHQKVTLNRRISFVPMHGEKELGKGLVEKIKSDLGLK